MKASANTSARIAALIVGPVAVVLGIVSTYNLLAPESARVGSVVSEVLMPFDTTRTDMPLFDNLLDDPSYFIKHKEMRHTIDYMSPAEYFQILRNFWGENPLHGVNYNLVRDYAEAMKRGAKFPMPTLEYSRTGYISQEGRHRMEAARQRLHRIC